MARKSIEELKAQQHEIMHALNSVGAQRKMTDIEYITQCVELVSPLAAYLPRDTPIGKQAVKLADINHDVLWIARNDRGTVELINCKVIGGTLTHQVLTIAETAKVFALAIDQISDAVSAFFTATHAEIKKELEQFPTDEEQKKRRKLRLMAIVKSYEDFAAMLKATVEAS